MNREFNTCNEAKAFNDHTEAAQYVKSVYDRTKTGSVQTGEVKCLFMGRVFKGITVDQEITVLFDHDYLNKISKLVPQSTFDYLKRSGIGFIAVPGETNEHIYTIKLTSSTVTKLQMNEFKECLTSLGLTVGIVVYGGFVEKKCKSDADLIPIGLAHYFP